MALPVTTSRPRDRGDAFADDGALLDAARRGEERAFAELVERYYQRALRFALNLGLPREDAEEVVQDSFVRVHRALPRFRAGAAFEPWLFRILANRCRSAHVRSRWWRRHDSDELALGAIPASGGSDDDVLRRLDVERLHGVMRDALDALPVEQREAFLLRHVEDLDYHEMTRITGAGLSALKMRVKRACDALRLRIQESDR
jgi:RNA polymerase sigma-70 factor (ECF subfamily)